MRPLLAVSVVVALAAPVGADDCATWTTTEPRVLGMSGDGGGLIYADDDYPCNEGCFFAVWIYQESNGLLGLQRGDEMTDDTCHGMIEPDTVIF